MKAPSTTWKEAPVPDRVAYEQRLTAVVNKLQQRNNQKAGLGRAFHRNQLLALEGKFTVLDELPAHACRGVFAQPGTHRAVVRLSSGDPSRQANWIPDLRGFAIKVFDITGDNLQGGTSGPQDFLLSHHDHQPVRDGREFLGFIEAAEAKGGGFPGKAAAVWHLLITYGPGRAIDFLRTTFRKFDGFASTTFTSGVFSCGDYAVKMRLQPRGRARTEDIVVDMTKRLVVGPVTWDVELIFYVDEATTPIENSNKVWSDQEAPVVKVAELTVADTSAIIDAMVLCERFDPWIGLVDHKPLGHLMLARKIAYEISRKGRGAPEPPDPIRCPFH
jgi:hypothetical protein